MDELWGEVFEPLRDEKLFSTAQQNDEMGTVVWANGADFAPEFLFNLLQVQSAGAKYRNGGWLCLYCGKPSRRGGPLWPPFVAQKKEGYSQVTCAFTEGRHKEPAPTMGLAF